MGWACGEPYRRAEACEYAPTADLGELFAMAAQGRLTPLIHRCVALEDAPDAQRDLEAGRAVGKIVIDMTRRGGVASARA